MSLLTGNNILNNLYKVSIFLSPDKMRKSPSDVGQKDTIIVIVESEQVNVRICNLENYQI